MERTFCIIKPDAVARNLQGEILAMIQGAGLRVVAMKQIRMTRQQAEGFYAVHNISSLTFLRLSLRPVRAAFIAAPKALKSYFGTGLFAIIIHPITFYCSPFLLDMSTLFYQLTKIIHMYMLTTSRFFCIVLLKGGKCLCYIACVFDKH